ncbi:MAG: DNA mismatch repair protein MutS [Acidobacteria bacterium]|nr:DNA mismatch repair protein MutS [Acidobacteriota bacterium]
MDNLTPMMQQYHQIKRQYPGKLVFFRLGDFYEMFYEDATVASRELDLTLTSRHKERGAPVPMCGVPYHSVDGYIARLIRKGYKIAICEQVEDPKTAGKIVRREVTRIITPGTVTDEILLEPRENNYIASLAVRESTVGLAFLDLSTGEFQATQFSGTDAWEAALVEMGHFLPKEIVHPAGWTPPAGFCSDGLVLSSLDDWAFNTDYAYRLLCQQFGVSSLDGYGCEGRGLAVSAAGGLLHYIRETQKSQLAHITEMSAYEPAQYLKLDETTVSNLELVRSFDGTRQGTLLEVLDHTKSGMGARLLRQWILRPALDLAEIRERQDAVEELYHAVLESDQLRQRLQVIHDLERLLSKVTLGTANARDLLALKDSFRVLPALGDVLQRLRSARLARFHAFDRLADLHDLLERAVAEDPPVSLTEGDLIKDGYHAELDELRSIRKDGKGYIARLEARERDRTGIQSLKVRYNQVFGYYIEVTRPNLPLVPADYLRKQTLVNAERFATPELKEYEEKVLGAEERIRQLEKELFLAVRGAVALQASRVHTVARVLAEVDVLLALAEAARKFGYTKPTVHAGEEILIREGRHPVVERRENPFIPNDTLLNNSTHQLLIITGPNMGGKSTYLRQVALLELMAQMGSFVPAREASLGVVDQIYTRVGASDNLARGRSTFLVEMIETARILNTSTPRSLILLDEVGRGTATFDGLSLAWAVAEYLHNHPLHRAKTLFATHYHELTKMASVFPRVKNFCVAVRQAGSEILFLRKVLEGTADRSYGIEVAQLAGMPQSVLARAREILTRLEKRQIDLTGLRKKSPTEEVLEEIQKPLF